MLKISDIIEKCKEDLAYWKSIAATKNELEQLAIENIERLESTISKINFISSEISTTKTESDEIQEADEKIEWEINNIPSLNVSELKSKIKYVKSCIKTSELRKADVDSKFESSTNTDMKEMYFGYARRYEYAVARYTNFLLSLNAALTTLNMEVK